MTPDQLGPLGCVIVSLLGIALAISYALVWRHR